MAPMNNRLMRPMAKVGFNPKSVTGLQLWLDASDRNSLFDADTGGSLISADGAVGRWEDKSGNGRHHTQATANNRPLWRETGRNGRGTVEFDGSNDRLVGDDTQYAKTNTAFTAVFVHLVDATAGLFPTLMSTKTNQTQNFRWINSSFADYANYAMGSNQNFLPTRYTSASRGQWRYVLYDFIGSAANTASSYSGRAARASLTQASSGSFGAESATGSSIASESGGGNLLKGQMAEIIIYSKVLSTSERDGLERYLQAKWSV
jgi:hypothetical protein